jgi:hypothetical protein
VEEACAIHYNNAEPIVKVWIEYLSYLSRVTNFSDTKKKEILRKNFNFAWDSLGRMYGSLEYTKFGDGNEGRRL